MAAAMPIESGGRRGYAESGAGGVAVASDGAQEVVGLRAGRKRASGPRELAKEVRGDGERARVTSPG